jgi:predicted ribosomally synthesized peptide with nif11-like leader
MSQEAVQAFVERVNDDASFRDGLIAADDNDARLRIVQDAGFDVTAEDLAALRRQSGVEELSEEDLQKIAGGGTTGTEITAVTLPVSMLAIWAAGFV